MKKTNIALALIFFGAASTLSFPPFNSWSMGLLVLFPVFYLIDHTSFNVKKTIILGYLLTLSFNIFSAHWLFYTIIIYGHLHWSLAAIVFCLYTLIVSTRYIIFLILIKLWKHLNRQKKVSGFRILGINLFGNKYLAYAFAWGFSEYFGWQLFHALGANSAGGNKLLLQIGDIFGIYGISIFWFLMNLVVYDLFTVLVLKRGQFKLVHVLKNKSLVAASILLIFAHIYGVFAIKYWENKNKKYETKRIALIQGNAPLAFEGIRSLREYMKEILESLVQQTEAMLEKEISQNKKPDLVVWPESSVPFLSFQRPGIYSESIKKLQEKYNIPVIINDVYRERKDRKTRYYNNLWLLGDDGKPVDYYHKIQLLPFGEFIPLGDKLPFLYKVAPEISGFSSGDEEKIFKLNGFHFLPSICYELLPPQFTLNFFQRTGSKAQIIINITNDAWFGPTIEPMQHIKASTLRAIELRLPVIRATNSGISAYIDVNGNIIEPTESFVKDVRVYDIPIPDKSHSVFSVIGLIPFHLFLMFGISIWTYAVYLGFIKSARKSRNIQQQ
jgi:apolipoprotein N-acyltransferase